MTAQANDSTSKSWVFGDEHHLQKKGAGHGIHKSDVICSTTGWLEEASQTLEYRKNYDGYWIGELFVKQVRTYGIDSDIHHTMSLIILCTVD